VAPDVAAMGKPGGIGRPAMRVADQVSVPLIDPLCAGMRSYWLGSSLVRPEPDVRAAGAEARHRAFPYAGGVDRASSGPNDESDTAGLDPGAGPRSQLLNDVGN
jgi:hypothetical protein